MYVFNLIVTGVFDVLALPFASHPAAGLIVLSMLIGAALTLLYRATSDARRIRRSRDVFKARVLEMRLYPDDLALILRAMGGALAAQGLYLRAAAKPLVIVVLAAVPVFFQMEARYARAPLAPGAQTIITARLKTGLDVRSVPTSLSGSDGLLVDARSVRATVPREVAWRVGVTQAGRHELTLEAYDRVYRFPVSARSDGKVIGRERRAHSFAGAISDIGLPRFDADVPIDALTLVYPAASYRVFGVRMSWLAGFAAASLVGALIPAWILRVAL